MKELVCCFIALLFACKNHHSSSMASGSNESDSMLLNKYKAASVIDRSTLDGCGFVVQLSDSSILQVVNLPDSVKKDQLKIWIKYAAASKQMSTCMAGEIVKMIDLKLRNK